MKEEKMPLIMKHIIWFSLEDIPLIKRVSFLLGRTVQVFFIIPMFWPQIVKFSMSQIFSSVPIDST